MIFRKNSKSHWDKIYSRYNAENLGWYEKDPRESLRLIDKTNIKSNILDVGCGKTTLIRALLEKGYENIIGVDLSDNAIEDLKLDLKEYNNKIHIFQCDILRLNLSEKVDIWHDRAVLHFMNSKKEEDNYFNQLKRHLNHKGYFILATFSKSNKNRCTGLKIRTWDENEVLERLGKSFSLIEAYDYIYTMPSKELREFRYMIFRREELS